MYLKWSDYDILEHQHKLNRRPRKKVDFELPYRKYYLSLHSQVAFWSGTYWRIFFAIILLFQNKIVSLQIGFLNEKYINY